VAQLGFGTYRISDKNPAHIQAITTAVEEGVTLFDTSTNYMNGDAERALGLAFYPMGIQKLEKIGVVSKFGYIQGTLLEEVKRGEKSYSEVVQFADHIYHCISPDFLEDQLKVSLERLNADSISCYLIHNPEYLLLDAINKDLDRDETLDIMYERLEKAFVALEKAVTDGQINSYGVSSNSFALKSNDPEFLPYSDLITIAKRAAKVAGSAKMHFTTLQLPINLLEEEGLVCAAWAKANGLRVLSNRPLNAQANNLMFRLATYDEPLNYYHHLNEVLEMTDDDTVRIIHNVIAQLDDVKHRFGYVGEYEQFLHTQIMPHLQKALATIDATAAEILAEALDIYLQEYAKMIAYECSKLTRTQIKEKLQGCEKPLQECTFDFLNAQEDIDVILVGMRKPAYVLQTVSLFAEVK